MIFAIDTGYLSPKLLRYDPCPSDGVPPTKKAIAFFVLSLSSLRYRL
ncbi:MAG: hypothetical protein RMY30_030075 [Nostoc sp. CmiSLP01]|nr:hypothetical protein [Nostoc sp. ChiSLP01]